MRFINILCVTAAILFMSSCADECYRVDGNAVTVEVSDYKEGGPRLVRLEVMGEKVIRVSATPERKFADPQSLVVMPSESDTPFEVYEDDGLVAVATDCCNRFCATTGALSTWLCQIVVLYPISG